MLIVLLFSCLMIVPMSHGIPVDKIEERNSTLPVINMVHNELKEKKITVGSEREILKNKNITVASEGEVILPNTPKQSLPKENQAFLITSAVDISTNKVKPRKGAFLDETKNISLELNSQVSNTNLSGSQPPLKSTASTNTTNANTIKGKPPILSAEAIAQADLLNSDPVLDDSEERVVKIHKISSNGHPGMIMPVVISVLVVPIFAVIGFMALRRGQEAWKNRHYKRMDFLLDGMYND